MLKLLLKILVLQPELLKEHAQGYAELVNQAWIHNLHTLKYRWTMYAISALTLFLSLILGGFALMLWCALPATEMRNAWVLLFLPLCLLILSGLIGGYARNLRRVEVLEKIKEQIRLDSLALRRAKNS